MFSIVKYLFKIGNPIVWEILEQKTNSIFVFKFGVFSVGKLRQEINLWLEQKNQM